MESKNKREGGRERRERDGNKEWRVRTRGRVEEREKGERWKQRVESKNKREGGRERRERDGNREWRVRTRGRVGEREGRGMETKSGE